MKLKINKGIFTSLLAGTLVFSGICACKKSDEESLESHNIKGHETNFYIENMFINDDDFVLLNVGDHDTIGVLFQDKKIRLLNDRNTTLGIIIDSDAKSEESVYHDVEYVKSLIHDFKIDYPVYFNIDSIITNDGLNNEMKTKIIMDFLEKCAANNIYVGVSGTDTNLCRMKKYCNITGYDAYLIQDSDEIKYDGVYYVYKNMDGEIISKMDLEKVISDKKLNRSEGFCSDGTYCMKADEDITDVALRYSLSVNELLSYNDLQRKDISEGTVLRIPNIIESNKTSVQLDEPIRGCDISNHEQNNSDWNLLAENFDFIILKSNEGTLHDSYFESNAANCNINNIPIGVYCYNAFNNKNCPDMESFIERQNAQVDCTISLLNNKKIDYPIYLDIEEEGGLCNNILTPEQVRTMLDIWSSKVTDNGYLPGVYANQSGIQYLQSCVDYKLSDRFQVWIAGGEQYGVEVELDEVHPSYSILNNEKYNATMVQSADRCINAGSGNSLGHLDVNYSIVDYSRKNETSNVDALEEKRFIRFPKLSLSIPIAGVFALAGIGFGFKRKKAKNNRYR